MGDLEALANSSRERSTQHSFQWAPPGAVGMGVGQVTAPLRIRFSGFIVLRALVRDGFGSTSGFGGAGSGPRPASSSAPAPRWLVPGF